MRYAFNTWCYGSFPTWLPSYPLGEVIDRLARIGYDGIEIGCAAPHAWPDYLTGADRRDIRRRLDDVGLQAASLLPAPGGGPGGNPASPIAAEREWTRTHYEQVVDLAAELGASRVLYIPGWLVYGTSRRDAWAWSVETLARVADHARTHDITLCVEPTPADSNFVDTPDHALEMMAASERPNVKVMFDTYHALYRKEVPADQVYQMGAHLAHVHVADTDRQAPGRGTMDFRPFMQALRDIDFDGFVTMETGFASRATHPDAQARAALEHLRAIEAELA
jgi:fructoselysine 3-epimerase